MNEVQLAIEKLRGKFVAGWSNHIDVDEGWYALVIACDAALTAIDPGYRIFQIKEKFGGLRYYVQASDPALVRPLQGAIGRFEKLAAKTCEATGEPGILMRSVGGRLRTLNPDYAAGTLHFAGYKVVNVVSFPLPDPDTPDSDRDGLVVDG